MIKKESSLISQPAFPLQRWTGANQTQQSQALVENNSDNVNMGVVVVVK